MQHIALHVFLLQVRRQPERLGWVAVVVAELRDDLARIARGIARDLDRHGLFGKIAAHESILVGEHKRA
jgi:hypothetical protein